MTKFPAGDGREYDAVMGQGRPQYVCSLFHGSSSQPRELVLSLPVLRPHGQHLSIAGEEKSLSGSTGFSSAGSSKQALITKLAISIEFVVLEANWEVLQACSRLQ